MVNADTLAILSYIAGIVSGLAPLVLYAWNKGLKLLPADLQKFVDETEADISETVRNISVSDIQEIIIEAEVLAKDGFTTTEAFELGILIIKVVAKNKALDITIPASPAPPDLEKAVFKVLDSQDEELK